MTIGGSFNTHDAAVVSVAERVVAMQDGTLSEMEPLVRPMLREALVLVLLRAAARSRWGDLRPD